MKTLILLLLMVPALSRAESTARITGTVCDRETGRVLPGANVLLVGTSFGAFADSRGVYAIENVPPGTYRVRASFVGYAPAQEMIAVGTDSTVHLDFLLVPSLIIAQPITITATRGRLRETPATFSTLEHEEIHERYTTQDIPVLLSELPSSTFYSEGGSGIGYTYLNMRGFDSRRIAVMVNGVPQNDPEDHNVYWLDFPDLASSLDDIQVQRGAGSAFYGPPAIGGSVNLVTQNFAHERSLELSAGMGSYNTRKYSASFSSGLVDNRYALHGRISRITSDGYREHSWVDFVSYFLGMVRYDAAMTTQFNFYGGPVADGLAYYGNPRSSISDRTLRKKNYSYWEEGYFVPRRAEEIENFSQPHAELLHEWRLSHSLTLNNTLFAVLGSGFFDYDGSWAPYSYYRLTQENGFPVTGDPDAQYIAGALVRAQVENRQFGWLPRLSIAHPRGELVVGGELRIHRSTHWGRLQYFSELPFEVPFDYHYYDYKGAKTIVSLYAHELYALRPDLTLMGDLQYAYSRYRLYAERYLGTDFTVPYHFLNPRLGVNLNLDPRWNTYLSAAYTSREPRLKNLYDAAEASTPASWGAVLPQFSPATGGGFDFSAPLVKSESLVDIELGVGYAAPGARWDMNLYWMDFRDEIVKSGRLDRFGQPVTGNAWRTRHVGAEMSGRVTLLQDLEFTGTCTLSRNSFVRHTDYSSGVPVSLDGNPIAGFPAFLANGRLTYSTGAFALSLSGRYVGKQYTDNFKDEERTVDPFFTSDAWASWQLSHLAGDVSLEVKVQVNNIFDRLYAAYGEGDQYFMGAERNFFINFTLGI